MAKKCPSKLLIVEDDPDQTALIRIVLSQWAQNNETEVDYVPSVAEALVRISSVNFDLVVTDCRLSDGTALDLLTEIKNRDLLVPVLLMAAAGDQVLAGNALKVGFLDSITKSKDSFLRLTHIIEETYGRYLSQENEKKLQKETVKENVQPRSEKQEPKVLSIRDELTGLYSHRFLQEKMAEEFARATRYRYPLSCLMIDIDDFRKINDSYGHLVGDRVLHGLGQFFTSFLRQADTVARYGGEEFVVLLPHIAYEGANLLADRLRKRIMDESFAGESGLALKISVSIGVSSYPEDPVDRKDTLLFYADKALFRAKSLGRNRIYLYQNMVKEYSVNIPDLKFNDEKVQEFCRRLFDVSEMAKRAYIEATKALINALEAKDPHTMGHAARVGHYSAAVAREMRFGEDDIRITVELLQKINDSLPDSSNDKK